MIVVKVFFWVSLAALVWTHVGYALVAALGARFRRRRVGGADIEPRSASSSQRTTRRT